MLRKIAIGVVAVVSVVVLIGLLLPRRWHVERSVVINASPKRIHPFIENFHHWQEWAVWTKEMDPQVRNTFDGPEEGVGAKWSWLGPKMGRGRLEIVSSDVTSGVVIDEAIENDEVNAQSRFSYVAQAGGTRVLWVDEGALPPVLGGYFRGVVERELDAAFQTGLDQLKRKVEALPAEPPPPTVPVPTEADAGVSE